MTYQEVVEATEHCLEENPVLERTAGHPCPRCGRHVTGGFCHRCREHQGARELHEQIAAGIDPYRTIEVEAALEVRSDCRDALTAVVCHLSGRGLLDSSTEEIARLHGLGVNEVDEALRAVRVVGPPGIGAENVCTMLTAQAEVLVRDRQCPEWLPHLVRDHLSDLSEGRLNLAAQALGLTEDDVRNGLIIIQTRLRPFAMVETNPIDVPSQCADVLLYGNADGSLDVEVPDSVWFGLSVVDLAAGLDDVPEAKQWLADHEAAARRLILQLDSRANVLMRVAGYAAEHQRRFLESGPSFHRPLTRTAVAQELGLHPSTVSRAVKGKRLRLPKGNIVDLSCLFGKGVAARIAVANLVAAAPDGRSANMLRGDLSGQGIEIARRTVSKYRHDLAVNSGALPRRVR
ncbi:RNA polymerase factor sigma-54 [Arthrobacter sp. L77]|uniref:RNA polymerase factor sigma-54 n=1 Tax=Arthrobacter sp. L77 TaxID=1496689 RepID=UPI0018CE2113|nr:hypothetical protein [Arthrobacter sp. L77]